MQILSAPPLIIFSASLTDLIPPPTVSGTKQTLEVSGAGGWDMAGVESGDGKVAQCNYHPLAINPGFPVDVNMTSKQEYSDHGRTWNTTADRVGLSGPFAYQA